MFAYSPFFKPIFWLIMGLIYTMTALGAPIWAEDLGLQMSWWKWILGFHLIISIVLGAVVWSLI